MAMKPDRWWISWRARTVFGRKSISSKAGGQYTCEEELA
jgi:hypothetical protein